MERLLVKSKEQCTLCCVDLSYINPATIKPNIILEQLIKTVFPTEYELRKEEAETEALHAKKLVKSLEQVEEHFTYWLAYDSDSDGTTFIANYPHYDSWLQSLHLLMQNPIDKATAKHVAFFIQHAFDVGDWESFFYDTEIKSLVTDQGWKLWQEIVLARYSIFSVFECIDLVRTEKERFQTYSVELFKLLRTFIDDTTNNIGLKLVAARSIMALVGHNTSNEVGKYAQLVQILEKDTNQLIQNTIEIAMMT
jgi:hypothetical protein